MSYYIHVAFGPFDDAVFSAINFGMNQQQFMGSQQSLNMYQQQQQQHQQQYNRNNYEFHQVQAAATQQQQREQRINQLSGRCGTGSVSSIHSLQSCTGKEMSGINESIIIDVIVLCSSKFCFIFIIKKRVNQSVM